MSRMTGTGMVYVGLAASADVAPLGTFSQSSMLLQVNCICPGLILIPTPTLYGPPEFGTSLGTSINSKVHILLRSQISNPSLLEGCQDEWSGCIGEFCQQLRKKQFAGLAPSAASTFCIQALEAGSVGGSARTELYN